MTLQYVSLTLDYFDGAGGFLNGGTATFTPSVQLTDATDHEIITQAGVTAAFKPSGNPVIKLLATDNSAVLPSGWAWTVTFSGVSGNPASFSFFLPFASGASQNLSAISPVSTAVTQFPANPMTTAGDMIYGAASPAGTPARLGIGTDGYVLTVDSGTHLPSWKSGLANPMTTLGDTLYGGASGAVTRLAGDTSNTRKFFREQSSAGVAAAPAWDTLQSGDIPANAANTSGTAANLGGGATLPAYLAPKAVALSFVGAGTTLVDASLGNAFNLTLTASTTTLGAPSNSVDGEVIRFRITQGGSGSFTLAYASAYDFGAAGSPTLSTAAAKVDILGFEYVASISKWCYLGSGLGF